MVSVDGKIGFDTVKGRRLYQTLFNFCANVVIENTPYKIPIPSFFKFDGASIPRLLWSTMGTPFDPLYIVAGCVHDKLYRTGEFPRKIADLIFREILKGNGVGWVKRNLLYNGVRSGGWVAWKKHRRNDFKSKAK